MEIEIEVFHHTEETQTFKEIGVDYDMSNCGLRPVTFYRIDAISPYYENGKEFSSIHTNNSEYITPLTYTQLKARIKNNS